MNCKGLFFAGIIVVLCTAIELHGSRDDNQITIRSYYPSGIPFNYQNLYLYYRLHYIPVENITLNVSIAKGSGEKGYFPRGYIAESDSGLYERGSYYLQLKEYFNSNKIVFGNYMPLFGQGLLFGGSYPLILYNPYYDLARYRDGLYPRSSTSKAVLLEGFALEYEVPGVKIRPFLSWNQYDCTAGESTYYKYNDNDFDGIPNEEDEDDFTGYSDEFPFSYSCKNHIYSSIRDESDYEIESERKKRNNLAEYVFGLNLSSKMDNLKIGGTLLYTQFNRLIDPYYNFDPGEGDKTSYYFRGKNFYSSTIYFKFYEPAEFFGELAGTFYRRLSYYPEFNEDFISSFGFSGGIRKKIDGIGFILWGAYIPPTFVNPHGLELPDGLNNITSGLFGINYVHGKKRFAHWMYGYKELMNTESSNDLETGISYQHRIEYPLFRGLLLKTKQNFELVDHYYYAPDALSLKISSKISLKYSFTDELGSQLSLENRVGGPEGERLNFGTGISMELLQKKEKYRASILFMYYKTDDDRFAYLYPYERSLHNWSFLSPSLHGTGFAGSLIYVRNLFNDITFGTKLRYELDLYDRDQRGVTVYVMSVVPF